MLARATHGERFESHRLPNLGNSAKSGLGISLSVLWGNEEFTFNSNRLARELCRCE